MIHEGSVAVLSPRRGRRRTLRMQQILDTAARILVDEGFEALTMNRLADQLDYVAGALYRYFSSKDALIAELQARALGSLERVLGSESERLEAWSAGHRTAPRVAALMGVLRFADLYGAFAVERPESFRLLSLTLGDPRERLEPREARRVVSAATPLLSAWGAEFDAAARAGALHAGDGGERAVATWAALHGTLQLKKLGRLEPRLFPIDRLAGELVQTLLLGWGAGEKDLRTARAALARAVPAHHFPENV